MQHNVHQWAATLRLRGMADAIIADCIKEKVTFDELTERTRIIAYAPEAQLLDPEYQQAVVSYIIGKVTMVRYFTVTCFMFYDVGYPPTTEYVKVESVTKELAEFVESKRLRNGQETIAQVVFWKNERGEPDYNAYYAYPQIQWADAERAVTAANRWRATLN